MNSIYQKTITSPIKFQGIGLHTGKHSTVRIMPGESDQGIVFKRVDLEQNNYIKANFNNVTSAKLCTTLENSNGVKVSTVEHLLAAIYIADIDNVTIEINTDEVPILDGSAKDFLNTLNKTEIKIQDRKRKYLIVDETIELKDGNRKISIEPKNDSFEVEFELNYKNQVIGKQKNNVNFHNDDLTDISNSRTFCLYEDIEKIKKAGLGKGGSLDNALIVDQNKILNEGGLRNEKEFVNHKILDLAGDFVLSGYKIFGKVNCSHGGHELSNLLLRKLFKYTKHYKILELNEILVTKKTQPHSPFKIAINA